MIEVYYGPVNAACGWPIGCFPIRVRALDVARAAASTLSAGRGRSVVRRRAHFFAVCVEVSAHLGNDAGDAGLHVVGLDGLDATARSEVVHRIGVGLARVVAERSPLGLVDFYNLDALAADRTGPVRVVSRRPGSRRRPDFAGQDDHKAWSLIEAKGRATTGELRSARTSALDQVQAVYLQDPNGTAIPIKHRAACVSRLGTQPLGVFADDPEADEPHTVLAIDELQLLLDYYALPRDLLAQAQTAGPGLSGAEDFAAIAVTGGLILAIHRALIPVLDDPERIATVRAGLLEELTALQAETEEADLSIGRDGFALVSRTASLEETLDA